MNIVGFVITKNNSDLLEKSVNKIPDCINTIFVSDDNSVDNPEKITKKLNIPIYKNKRSAGYGSNVKNGLDIAFNKYNADYAIEIHGDGAQFHPNATLDALSLMESKNADLIVGSRFLKFKENMKLGYPLVRMLPNFIISISERIILNIPISDFHQGFKIYSKKLFNTISINNLSDTYLFSFEIILHTKLNNMTIKQVPVLCDYKSPHTSHKLFGKNSAFVYQLETFKLIYSYFRNKL